MMRERLKIERHEAMYGPHFNEEQALKAVSKMENEDGSRGEHWSLEEATSVSSSQVSSNPASVNTNSGKALLNGSGEQMPTEEISTGNKYLIYYDKRTGVFQTINHIVAPATA